MIDWTTLVNNAASASGVDLPQARAIIMSTATSDGQVPLVERADNGYSLAPGQYTPATQDSVNNVAGFYGFMRSNGAEIRDVVSAFGGDYQKNLKSYIDWYDNRAGMVGSQPDSETKTPWQQKVESAKNAVLGQPGSAMNPTKEQADSSLARWKSPAFIGVSIIALLFFAFGLFTLSLADLPKPTIPEVI